MTFPRLLVIIAVSLFGLIGIIGLFKSGKSKSQPASKTAPIEVSLGQEVRSASSSVKNESKQPITPAKKEVTLAEKSPTQTTPTTTISENLPHADRVDELFRTEGTKLPIVETITYKSRVSWQKGRPAWLSDYARQYETSRHFIARSLNGKPDYLKQDLVEGDRFNILRKDKKIQFYLLADLSRCKLWLYYDDLNAHERVLLKTYMIGVGRVDGSRTSGFLTPIGQYTLGNKIAIYRPKVMGHYNGEQTEMVTVFGTRWIPLDKELQDCSAPAKGLGLHGVPMVLTPSGERQEDMSSLGKYQSDGCIRLSSKDMEEIFAIIITKPAVIELVKDFHEAHYKNWKE